MVDVSVIVPVYNTEKFLQRCLDSLTDQTLKDIEIICVNDGSTDNSLKILEDNAQKDKRIKIVNQENKKQGAARNAGMQIATGEYIGFIDSDDWVDLTYFEKLFKTAKEYDSDIALATNVRIGKNKFKKRLNLESVKKYTELQDKLDICHQWRNECPTNKIYKKSYLEVNNIRWPEGVYCEDKLFTIKAVYFANAVVTVPEVYYYYFDNPKSTVNSCTKEHRKKLNIDKNNARRDVINFLNEQNANVRDKNFWYVKRSIRLFNTIPLFTVKQSTKTTKGILFGFIPVFMCGGNK